MKIHSFKIENYKSFRETPWIELASGFNIVVAPNNFGKTALLEILSTRYELNPHRSILFPPTQPLNQNSILCVELGLSGQELKDIALGSGTFYLPFPNDWLGDSNAAAKIEREAERMFMSTDIRVTARFRNSTEILVLDIPSHSFDANFKYSEAKFIRFDVSPNKMQITANVAQRGKPNRDLHLIVAQHCSQSTYSFLAERLNLGTCPFGNNPTLIPNASNLAEVINILQANPLRLQELNDHMANIFGNVFQINARPASKQGNYVEIIVWPVDPDSKRGDLAVELEESGTGIGQVLAMLYVAITSIESRIIIIDEPNTFLHPGAARKLVEILKLYPQHQYIFATHSPEIIRISEPGALISVTWENNESKLVPIDAQNIADLQAMLLDVGAKLSDVFGADAILWVEGLTEERCFPRILKQISQDALFGVSILAVRSTGEFESKRPSADLIWEIYEKLSSGRALLPPAIAFVFDREGRSENEIRDLSRRSGKRVQFLPRRTFENYLINPNAIGALLNTLETFQENPVTENVVRDWLLAHGGKKMYCGRNMKTGDLDNLEWLASVHGAKLLARLFSELSEHKEEYRKRSHSVWLTDWLLENDPGAFSELAELLLGLLPEAEIGRRIGNQLTGTSARAG